VKYVEDMKRSEFNRGLPCSILRRRRVADLTGVSPFLTIKLLNRSPKNSLTGGGAYGNVSIAATG
jgi:hypothetical protein